MARLLSDPDTIRNSERALERLYASNSKPLVVQEPKPVVTGRIQNFTCPACQETLPEVRTINGRIQGWCGNKGIYINQEV